MFTKVRGAHYVGWGGTFGLGVKLEGFSRVSGPLRSLNGVALLGVRRMVEAGGLIIVLVGS